MHGSGEAKALVVKLLKQRQVFAERVTILHRLEGDELAFPVQPQRISRGQRGDDRVRIGGDRLVDQVRALPREGASVGIALGGQWALLGIAGEEVPIENRLAEQTA